MLLHPAYTGRWFIGDASARSVNINQTEPRFFSRAPEMKGNLA